jgi:peptide/nickel transport system permease protein
VPAPSALLSFAPLLHVPRGSRFAGRFGNRRRTLVTFIVAVLILLMVVVVGRLLATGEPSIAATTNFTAKNLTPSLEHLFGTDWMGRDMFARTLAGLATSVLVGLLAACASALLALVLGTLAALGGHRVDAAITWLIDLVLGIPHIVLLILISFALGKGFWGVAIGVALTHWPNLARVIRAEILQCRESVFVVQARRLGAGSLAIIRRHVLPHIFPQFLVGLVLLFPHAILHEAAITFLGFGLPPEQPAIGIILSESMSYLSVGYWWLALFPGLALIVTVLLFDRAGSNLRRLIDPYRSQE